MYRHPSDFQLKGDPPNTWRQYNYKPEGFEGLVAEEIPVAGISYKNDAATQFVMGVNREILLERDPDNEYDPNAIKVIGVWDDLDGEHRAQIGWIPKVQAGAIAYKHRDKPLVATIEAIFKPHRDKGIGLRINVWTTE